MIRVAGVAEWEHEFEHQSDLYESRVWVPELGFGWKRQIHAHARPWATRG
jgi:hypothetical protein